MRHLTPGGPLFSPGFREPERESSTPPEPEAADLDEEPDRPSSVLAEAVPDGPSIFLQAEIQDLERELCAARKKAKWHFVWTVLGISPTAVIPALGLMREGNIELLVLLAVLVTIWQGYLGAKASRKAGDLEAALDKLRESTGT